MMWEKQTIANYSLKDGFSIRTYKNGDAQDYIDVCADTLGTGDMSEEDLKKTMLDREGICPESIFSL